jgi:bifunctional UDP-N-acetylglucosamine pyrophosphorylase/glucosamine-1-phosphate N-acetyltransferase
MQAIILAAGNGIRLRPLSITKPKPLIEVLDKSILEHNLEQLSGLVKEVILVVGFKGEMIKKKFGSRYKGIKIKYIWQKNQLGTGDAAKLASRLAQDKFLLLNGDDFYFKEDIKKTLKKFPSLLAKEVENPLPFGVILKDKNFVKEILEKPKKPISKLVNTGLYYLPKKIFDFKIKKSARGEYEFTDYLKQFIEKNKLYLITADFWMPISYSWNLLEAAKFLIERKKKKNQGKIEKGVQIKGKVIIEKGTVIRSGSYIIGPVYIGKNCTIGPNCFLREYSVIRDNCRVGQAVEIKNSIIGKNTNVAHLSYVGDSVIGENCNLGAGTIIANLRHDEATIKTMINGDLVDTGRRKFGTIFGDGVKTGIGTLIYPGRKIWPKKTTLPGETVKKDIK